MIDKRDILFICDFETTGVNPEKDYPIEIGGLFVDYQFNIIDTINKLIIPTENIEILFTIDENDNKLIWKSDYQSAFLVHKITPDEILEKGKPVKEIIKLIEEKIKKFKKVNRVIIVSDNAQFEYNFMKRLYQLGNSLDKFPFHYIAFDTNMLLEMVEPSIGDAIPVHRAFQDATRLYRNIVRALEKTNYFEKIKQYYQ